MQADYLAWVGGRVFGKKDAGGGRHLAFVGDSGHSEGNGKAKAMEKQRQWKSKGNGKAKAMEKQRQWKSKGNGKAKAMEKGIRFCLYPLV